MDCLAAKTTLRSFYPEFINVSVDDAGVVYVTLREGPKDGQCGQTITASFGDADFEEFLQELNGAWVKSIRAKALKAKK